MKCRTWKHTHAGLLAVVPSEPELVGSPSTFPLHASCLIPSLWLGGLLVERRTSVSQIRGSIPRQVAVV